MKKRNRCLSLTLCICLTICFLCTTASAQEIPSKDEKIYHSLTEICSAPDATMLDFIRIANPEAFASMTDDQKADFKNMNYQAAVNGAYSSNSARIYSGYMLHADISFHARQPILYYDLMFQTVDENGKPVNLPTVWGTTTVTNEYTKETIASSSDGGNNEDSIYITEHTRDFDCGYWYKNTCLVYGYDPYSQPFSDVATAVEYADFYD